jgi:bifunctional non-homologous end joining protein LigD
MMAVAAATLPIGPAWSYEVKWDGYRAIAIKDQDKVILVSRNLRDVTSQYPAVAAAVASLRSLRATLDGEIVALDERGRPSFQALQHRTRTSLQIVYFAFDLLNLEGRDVMRLPLAERRIALASVVEGSPVMLSEPLPGTPKQIERAVRRLGLEGVMAKRRDSRYEPGKRSGSWVKVRFARRQEMVVGGFKPAGRRFDSILVGYYDGRDLRFAGKVRAGFTPHLRAELFDRLGRLLMKRCPFVNLPNSAGKTSHWGEWITADEMKTIAWVRPVLVVEVTFTEWTRDSGLRHAAFAGFREDKPPRQVRKEERAGRSVIP